MIGAAPDAALTATFESWDKLVSASDRDTLMQRLALAYAAGLLLGFAWGGWRGALAGLLAASAGGNGIAASTYGSQSADAYRKAALIVAGVGAAEVALALWLASGVASQKEDEGRSVLSLAH